MSGKLESNSSVSWTSLNADNNGQNEEPRECGEESQVGRDEIQSSHRDDRSHQLNVFQSGSVPSIIHIHDVPLEVDECHIKCLFRNCVEQDIIVRLLQGWKNNRFFRYALVFYHSAEAANLAFQRVSRITIFRKRLQVSIWL